MFAFYILGWFTFPGAQRSFIKSPNQTELNTLILYKMYCQFITSQNLFSLMPSYTHTDPSYLPLHGIAWPSESRTVVQSLVFYILFTAPNFWAWKFYTQKCVNLRHKLHESTLFYTIWNICPFSGKPAPRQMVFRAGNTVLAHCWEEVYCYASRNNTFKHGLHHKQDLFNTLS